LRLLLRLKDRAVRARDRNCVLPNGCAGQSENKHNRTPAAELDFGSEANHALSNYQNGIRGCSDRKTESTADADASQQPVTP
jgi:hypothetical protein